MRKIVIMLSDDQLRAVGKICRLRHLPRSRVVQEAVARYLKEEEESEAVRVYIEGSRRNPERMAEARALAAAAAETMEPEDWS